MRLTPFLLVIAFLLLAKNCDEPHARLVLKDAAASAWDDHVTVGAQFQLENVGNNTARELRVTEVDVDGGSYIGPVSLPVSLGDLSAGTDRIFNAVLKVAATDGRPREVELEGNFLDGDDRRHFRLKSTIRPNSAPPGPIQGKPGRAVKQNPNTAVYPPARPRPPLRPNAETPVFVPIGPPRQLFPPTPNGTNLGTSTGSPSVEIPRNATTMTSAGVPPDPNAAAAAADGAVLTAYNTGVSFSPDGGQTFTDIPLFSPQPGNPSRTSFFPQSDGGLCCDQVTVYVPRQNLIFWLQQHWPVTQCTANCPPQPAGAPPPTLSITQSSRLRVAWATPEAAAADFWNAWSYVDLTGTTVPNVSTGLGVSNTEWLDYPDMAWSDNFLYVGVDHAISLGSVYSNRRIVARLSLADIANPAVTNVNYQFAELTGSNALSKTHFVQGAPGRMMVGALDNSSTMRVFTWRDDNGFITPSSVGISRIQQGASFTSTAPDGSDWLAVSFPGNITGATYRSVEVGRGSPARDEYLFAFDAGANPGFGRPRAYLRLETLTPNFFTNNYSAFAEYDVWNNDYAFAMGALGTSGTEIGITLAVGGGTIGYPQGAVGYKDDFIVYQVTNSNATQISRFGDYFSNRPIAGGRFAAETYDVVLNPLPPGTTSGTCATVGCFARMRFVEYGRTPAP